MEAQGEAPQDQLDAAGDTEGGGDGNGTGAGEAEAARYALARCASQSSLDESSQRPAPPDSRPGRYLDDEFKYLDAAGDTEGGGGEGNGTGAGEAEAARYALARCASQSSLDESSQRPAPPEPPAAPTHATHLLDALARLRHTATLCDVKLQALPQAIPLHDVAHEAAEADVRGDAEEGGEGGEGEGEGGGVWAHRAVLAACSPYFRAMFTQFEERSRSTVTIQNVEPAALQAIVEYMYDPESLQITEDNVQALLSSASLLQVSGVRAAATAFLARALAPDNALGIRAFADLHACLDLARHAATYIDLHFVQVLESEEFLALSPDTLCQLLDSDRIVVPNEEVILDAVIRWMQHDPASRRAELGSVLEHVRLPLVGVQALVAAALAEPLSSAGLRVKDLVIEALSLHLLRPDTRPDRLQDCPRLRVRALGRPRCSLLVVGGQAPKAIREVEACQLERASWRPGAALPSRRCRAGLAHLPDHGAVYAVGGFNGTLRVRSVDVYSVSADSWSAGPPLIARRSTLGVAVIGTRIYAVGGFDGATGLISAEVLDTADLAAGWRPIANMSTRRSSVGVGVLGGRLYAVGGYDGTSRQCLHTVERYDPATDRWEAAAEMSARRSGAGVAVLGDALYAVGGHDGPAVRRSVERYREGEGWSAAPPMAHARRNAGVVAHAGKLYVVGGDDGAANLASVEVFDPATDSWSMLPAGMSVGRSYAGVCVVQRPPPA